MIVFSLKCANDHVFDEWFTNSGQYEDKKAQGELRCPECGDDKVAKAIMAPRIGKAAVAPPAPCGAPAGCGGGCAFANDF